MNEQDNNEFVIDPEQVAESLCADAKPLCPNCFNECDDNSYYCKHCESVNPMNPLAAYMPFVNLRMYCGFYGNAWREASNKNNVSLFKRLLLLLLLIVQVPLMIVIGLPFLLFDRITKRNAQK